VHGAGGVTGGLAVQLAVARGATVVATAGPTSAGRVRDYGARPVVDYHDPASPAACETRLRAAKEWGRRERGPRGAATALQAVADEGRLATITTDPPPPERGVTVLDVYVQADGPRLAALVARLAQGQPSLRVAATLPLAEAATALRSAIAGGAAGASVLTLEPG
jgi:NADPH:quinone reductase-like Zn-dependent oxidoreductase